VQRERRRAARRLAKRLGRRLNEPDVLFAELLEWLGRSDSPLVVPWLEDLWLEERRVNLPGTRSSERPNWQSPMRKLLDDIFTDPAIDELIRRLDRARHPE
jgi:4-alpha-glucanotransferase